MDTQGWVQIVQFSVDGVPCPQGSIIAHPVKSKTGWVHCKDGKPLVVTRSDAPNLTQWRFNVGATCRDHYCGPVLNGPFALQLTFRLVRPLSHYRTGRYAGELRPDALAFPVVTPDLSKLLRAVEDSLTGVLWQDDKQIVRELLGKEWIGRDRWAGVEVEAWRLPPGAKVQVLPFALFEEKP